MGTIHRKRGRAVRGFTLVELMAVIVIIGLMVGTAALTIPGMINKARVGTARQQIATFDHAIELFCMDHGRYPSEDEGLDSLINAPAGLSDYPPGGYLDKPAIPKDPWKNEYGYFVRRTQSGVEYIVVCYGSDGVRGGTGYAADIASRDISPDTWFGGG